MNEIEALTGSKETNIPTEWNVKFLGDLGVFSKGKGILKDEVIANGLPCVRYGEIYTSYDYVIQEFRSFISDKTANESKEIKNGDILFAGSGETIEEIGKSVAYVGNEKAFAGGDVIILSTNKTVDTEYLSYLLETDIARKQKRKLGQGNSVVHIYSSDLKTLKLPIPKIPEQQKIARVLGSIDDAINITAKLISQKEISKKWLMQQFLTGKKRLKGFSEEWKEYYLNEMFSERNETKQYDLPLLSVGSAGVYPQSSSIKKDTSNEDKSKYKKICVNDIGYNTMRMWQGRSALSSLEGIVSPAYTIVTPKKNANSLFFSYLFKTPKLTSLFWRNSQGLVEDTLNCKFKDFSKIILNLPEVQEQRAISNILNSADKEIDLLKQKVEKLKEQKKGMMQQLLTGKRRLK